MFYIEERKLNERLNGKRYYLLMKGYIVKMKLIWDGMIKYGEYWEYIIIGKDWKE